MTPSTPDIPSYIHGLSIKDAYVKLDIEIAQLETRLSSLKTLRNSLAPISKIPTEILSKMFRHCYEPRNFPFSEYLDINTQFFISWVCRHWRDTALATPNLWTIISKKSRKVRLPLDFVQELLMWSRGLNLALNLYKPSQAMLRSCLSEISKTQHLQLLSASSGTDLNALLSQPAPALISFDLLDYSNSKLSPFSGNHPNLFQLTISGSSLTPISPLMAPTLTSLQLIKNSDLQVNNLIVLLASIPNLTELVLVESLRNEIVVTPSQQLDHSSLQILSVTDSMTDMIFDFLGCLNIPQAIITVIWPQNEEVNESVFENLSMTLNLHRRRVPFQIYYLSILERPYVLEFSLDISETPI